MAYTGIAGIHIQLVDTFAYQPLVGLLGITFVVEGNLPVKVTDRRGRNLGGVKVTAANPTSGIPKSVFTDADGNALLQADTGSNTITALKEQTFAVKNSSGVVSLTFILDPPIKHF